MYTDLLHAEREVQARWNNPSLRNAVAEYLGTCPFDITRGPYAVLARHIASPNHLFLRFSKMVERCNLPPILLEFSGDSFNRCNVDKESLINLCFSDEIKCSPLCCVNVTASATNDLQLGNIKTFTNESLIMFHHRLFKTHLRDTHQNFTTIDVSSWLSNNGKRSAVYYKKYLALFVCFGVLFENFLDEGSEGKFTSTVVKPALEAINKEFGFNPLIVRLLPPETETAQAWCWYPNNLLNTIPFSFVDYGCS